jgi:hypothetical protein
MVRTRSQERANKSEASECKPKTKRATAKKACAVDAVKDDAFEFWPALAECVASKRISRKTASLRMAQRIQEYNEEIPLVYEYDDLVDIAYEAPEFDQSLLGDNEFRLYGALFFPNAEYDSTPTFWGKLAYHYDIGGVLTINDAQVEDLVRERYEFYPDEFVGPDRKGANDERVYWQAKPTLASLVEQVVFDMEEEEELEEEVEEEKVEKEEEEEEKEEIDEKQAEQGSSTRPNKAVGFSSAGRVASCRPRATISRLRRCQAPRPLALSMYQPVSSSSDLLRAIALNFAGVVCRHARGVPAHRRLKLRKRLSRKRKS